jgi:hypothetical protein
MCGRVAELMHLLERVGDLYVGAIMKPAWASFEEEPTERTAIELFLRQYAYERLGASADLGIAPRSPLVPNSES